ncbi:conserved exported hypothetical protein [Pseudomonas sp. IT-P294]
MIRVAMAAAHTAAMAATRTAAMATAVSATVSTTMAPSVTATATATASITTATAIFRIGRAHDGQVNGEQWRSCKHQGAGKDRKETFIL